MIPKVSPKKKKASPFKRKSKPTKTEKTKIIEVKPDTSYFVLPPSVLLLVNNFSDQIRQNTQRLSLLTSERLKLSKRLSRLEKNADLALGRN